MIKGGRSRSQQDHSGGLQAETYASMLESSRRVTNELAPEKQQMNKRYSPLVARHQWIAGELAQMLALVGGFRRKLCDCAVTSWCDATGDRATQCEGDVDIALQQVEQLLTALVRLHPGDVEVDVDDSQRDRLPSTAGRLLIDHRLIQLHQALRENRELKLSVERLESGARCLKDYSLALRDQLAHLRAAGDNVRAELQSQSLNSDEEALSEITNRTQQLQVFNNTLQMKVAQLGDMFADKSIELQTKIEQLEAEREALAERERDLERAVELSQHTSGTSSPVMNDDESLMSRIQELETQLRLHQDSCASMKLTLQREQELSRRTEKEKNQLRCKIEELQSEANQSETEFDTIRKQLDDDNEIIHSQNDGMTRKNFDVQEMAKSDSTPSSYNLIREENSRLKEQIETLNDAILRKSEVILEMAEKIRQQQLLQQHQYSLSTARNVAITDGSLRVDSESEVADIYTRLHEQNAALDEAFETRDVLLSDMDQATMDNDRLLCVARDLRAQLDDKDSSIVRLRANITDLEGRLTSERHDFCEAVDLVRRENAAECDKVAGENHHLVTMLQELESSYTADRRRVFSSDEAVEDVAEDNVDTRTDATPVDNRQQLQDCSIATASTTVTADCSETSNSAFSENATRQTDRLTDCDNKLIADMSATIAALQHKVSLLESRNDELRRALNAEHRQTLLTEHHRITSLCSSGCHTDQTLIDSEPSHDSALKSKIGAETNLKKTSTTCEHFALSKPPAGKPSSGQTVAKGISSEDGRQRELMREEHRTSEQVPYFDEHVNELMAKLASNTQTMEQLRAENNELRQKLRQQLSIEMCLMDIDVNLENVGERKPDATSDRREDGRRATVEHGGDMAAAETSHYSENRALQQHINVSVQHAVTHSVAAQTTQASVHGPFDREIYSLWINNQTLLAELLRTQVRAIDAMQRRPSDADLWHCRLRRVTSNEIQRKMSSTAAFKRQLQRRLDNSDEETCLMTDADEKQQWLGELKRFIKRDNNALRYVVSTLNVPRDTDLLQIRGDHHGDDTEDYSSTHLHLEVSRLQQLLLESEERYSKIIKTYRRHLLSSVEGDMDPAVRDSLFFIIQSKKSDSSDVF